MKAMKDVKNMKVGLDLEMRSIRRPPAVALA